MIDYQKAYLIGLLIGGGTISDKTFIINLPYDKWGMDAHNMNAIAVDILTKISDRFKQCYNVPVTYEIGNKRWTIKPFGDFDLSSLKEDLKLLGLPQTGELINTVDLAIVKNELKGISVENLLSGIFDTRASLAKSHRRFANEAPVVSIEIPGSSKNFKFVVQLCSWLTQQGSVTDQILYNHPCQHSPSDPDYKGWKKGFKIRFLVKSFLAKHSFAMQAKSFDIATLEKYQSKSEQLPCIQRKIKHVSPVSIHSDINSKDLPKEVRNALFFHYHHICAAMGCPYAPTESVKEIIGKYQDLVTVFPRLAKGHEAEMKTRYLTIQKEYFPQYELDSIYFTVENIIQQEVFKPYTDLEQGLAFLFSTELNGKRHIGSKDIILKDNLHGEIEVIYPKDIEYAPILAINPENKRAVIISTVNSKFNRDIVKSKLVVEDFKVKIM